MPVTTACLKSTIKQVLLDKSFVRSSRSTWQLHTHPFCISLKLEYLRIGLAYEFRTYVDDVRYLDTGANVSANACIEIVTLTLDRQNGKLYIEAMTPRSGLDENERKRVIKNYIARLIEYVEGSRSDDSLRSMLSKHDSVAKIADSGYLSWLGIERPPINDEGSIDVR